MWIGNKASMAVHDEDCEFCESILEPEWFDELYHALSQGFREAGCCLTDTPYALYGAARESRKRLRGRASKNGCSVCGESRYVERAHIVPRSIGGSLTMPLCPNHHKAYDEGLLTELELKSLESRFGDVVVDMHGRVASLR